MSRTVLDIWIPEDRGSNVLQVITQTSAVEALSTKEPMKTDAKIIPAINGVAVSVIAKGGAYPEDSTVDSEVILKSRKFGTAIRIAEEDLEDIPTDVIANKQKAWATAYAVELDNACLGTTGASDGAATPFDSVYRVVSTNAAVSATNLVKTAGALTYDHLSNAIAAVERGAYFGDLVIIAHPFFKGGFRSIKDTTGEPVFVQGLAGTPDTLFGYNVVWSRGAKTSAVASSNPTGNPLLIAVSKEHLLLGERSGPESFVIPGSTGASALTDETILKMRSRRAFVLGNAAAAAVIEVS